MSRRLQLLRTHVDAMRGCHACPQMVPPALVQPSLPARASAQWIDAGKLAIAQILQDATRSGQLVDIIGTERRVRYHSRDVDVIALPQPAPPGCRSHALIARHPAWQRLAKKELRA